MYQVLDYNSIDKFLWDKFISDSSYGWLHHTSDFMKMNQHLGENKSFAIMNGNEILAIYVLYGNFRCKKKLFGLVEKRRGSLFSIGGFCIKDDLSKKQFKKVTSLFKETIDNMVSKYGIKSFNTMMLYAPALLPKKTNWLVNPLIFWGQENIDVPYSLVDLENTNEDDIYKNCSETTRQEIKKISNDENYNIRVANPSEEDLCIYYNLHKKTYKRTNAEVFPLSYFKELFFNLLKKDYCHILFLEYKNKVIASNIFVKYKGLEFYLANASEDEKSNGVNKFLVYKQLTMALKENAKSSCIGGSRIYLRSGKLKGLAEFKTSFGGSIYTNYDGKYILK